MITFPTFKKLFWLYVLLHLITVTCLYAQENDQPLRYSFGFKADYADDLHALVVTSVKPDSPAAKADLRIGDLIVEIDYSRSIVTFLYNTTRMEEGGKRRTFTVIRNRQRMEINITPVRIVDAVEAAQ